jgi:hypothetical protein
VIATVGVGVAMVGLFAARSAGLLDLLGSAASSASTSQQIAAGNAWLAPPGAPEERAGCVDQTTSSDSAFASMVLSEVADAVSEWTGPQSSSGEVAPRPALDLTLRPVSTHSSATDQQAVHVAVPAVPGLKAPPPLDDTNYAVDKLAWDEAANIRAAAWQAANQESATGTAALRGLPLDHNTNSAISGCLAAAAASTPSTATRRLLLASDLQENKAAVTGVYSGSPLLLVQSCPAGSEAGCPALARDWTARLTAQGAGPVEIVRADAATAAIKKWVMDS